MQAKDWSNKMCYKWLHDKHELKRDMVHKHMYLYGLISWKTCLHDSGITNTISPSKNEKYKVIHNYGH